jgi:hypothetical protein
VRTRRGLQRQLRLFSCGVEAIARALGGASGHRRLASAIGLSNAVGSGGLAWTDGFVGVLAADLIPAALQSDRVKELLELSSAESLARRPSDLRRFSRELDEALREAAARPPSAQLVPEAPAAPAPIAADPAAAARPSPSRRVRRRSWSSLRLPPAARCSSALLRRPFLAAADRREHG